jgi:hypothetical protein
MHKTARVPSSYKSASGFTLGAWVSKQRINKEKLSEQKARKLEALDGWSWDPLGERWDKGVEYLRGYFETHGDLFVPPEYELADGFKLGQWVGTQRRVKDTLSEERQMKLESILGWVWDVRDAQWYQAMQYLVKYSQVNGHCSVPQKFLTDSGFSLGQWVSKQRQNRENLPIDKQKLLESLPDWSWQSKFKDQWETGFSALKRYSEEEGDCLVPAKFISQDGFKLGIWVGTQRKGKASLAFDRKNRLESLNGWSWDARK